MGNVLEFALGIQTSEFLKKLGFASGELLSFASVGEMVRIGIERLNDAINEGASLKAMSSATGESVSKIYQLQHGLEAIGATADVPMLMMRMQNALSGMNEEGQRTDVLFARMGLDLNQLRAEGPVDALRQITQAMSGLNGNQMAGVGEQIFGRGGAETALQMARNIELFDKQMSASSNTGALLDKFASTFEGVKADWSAIQGDVDGVWVVIAGNIAPTLENLFTRMHAELKDIGPAIAGALQTGQLETLLVDALNAGFEQGTYYGERAFSVLALGFGEALYASMIIAFENIIPMVFHLGENIDKVILAGKATAAATALLALDVEQGNKGAIAGDVARIDAGKALIQGLLMQGGKDFGADFAATLKTALGAGGWISADMDAAWKTTGGNAPHTALDIFHGDVDRLAVIGTALGASGTGAGGGAGSASIMGLESHWHPEFTALEKMGFVMRGGGIGNFDEQKVSLLTEIKNGINKLASGHANNPVASLITQTILNPFDMSNSLG